MSPRNIDVIAAARRAGRGQPPREPRPPAPEYLVTPHMHRYCTGRLLYLVGPPEAIAPGAPRWLCATCEKAVEAHGELCWCGYEFGRGRVMRCVHMGLAEEIEGLAGLLGQNGCAPDRGPNPARVSFRVGIVDAAGFAAIAPPDMDAEMSMPTWDDVTWNAEKQIKPKRGLSGLDAIHDNVNQMEYATTVRRTALAVRYRGHLPGRAISSVPILWSPTPHVCRHCQGRVLVSMRNVGMTPGGDPVYRCADCAAFPPEYRAAICWCGHDPDEAGGLGRGNRGEGFACMRYDRAAGDQAIALGFLMAGHDLAQPRRKDKRVIGVVSLAAVNLARRLPPELLDSLTKDQTP